MEGVGAVGPGFAGFAQERGDAAAGGLRKGDVDFDAGVIMVSRSHDRDIPKGGRVEAVPVNEELVPYLKKAMTASPSEPQLRARAGGPQRRRSALSNGRRAAEPARGGWRFGAAVTRRQQRHAAPRGSIYYPFTTRPRKGACTVESTRNRWKAIPRT